MRPWLRNSFVFFVMALLVSCATAPGVRVAQTTPPPHPLPPIQVIPEQEANHWASQHALVTQGFAVANEPHAWTLRVVSTQSWETRRNEDLFCGPWLARSAYWGYDPWYRPHTFGPCSSPTRERERAYEVRTLTWSLVDDRGALRWHASTRQSRPAGPPVEEALRLAASLRKWSDAGQM